MTVETPSVASVKITCSRDELNQALQLVTRAVSTRASVQILAGVLVHVEEDVVHLSATDLEMALHVSFGAETTGGDGQVVVPGRLLADIVRLLPPGEITIAQDGEGAVSLTQGSSSYRLHTFSPADFPRLPVIDESRLLAIGREAFLETIGKVARAASKDESRPVLTGILLRLEPGKLVMAATDSYRLSVKETSLPSSSSGELEAIVPARCLAEVARIAQGADTEEIEVGVQDNEVAFRVGGIWLTARRIDGQFPNYKQLRPESFEVEVTVSRDELTDAVRRVGVMAQRNSPLRLRFEEGQLTIQAQTQDVGEAHESLPIAYGGEVLEIGFNPDFLRDGLESVSDPEIRLRLISPLRPGLISGAGEDFWYLIMPIRLAG
jgi:DNA polymerase-3 subunit beta